MKTIVLLMAAVLLFSCKSNPGADNNKAAKSSHKNISDQPVNEDFRAFIAKFKILQLPLTIKTLEINDSTLPGLEGHDTNYIRNEYPGTRQCAYGLLPDTTNNYKIIWLLPAEIYAPILTTFSKQGQKLSEASLGVGGCGSDCCFECNETIIINKDLSIYSADSIKSCECDDNGPKPETMRKYARVKTTKIGIDGHFTFSDIVEKDY